MNLRKDWAWFALAAIGGFFIIWGLHQAFRIPGFPASHWAWLTADSETLAYFKFWFRIHGVWTMANGMLIASIAATAFRQGEPWSAWVLAYLPLHLLWITTQLPWLFMITLPAALVSIAALWTGRIQGPNQAHNAKQQTWIVFLIIGILIVVFAYYNLVVFPGLDPADPDRGWAWLTTDPDVIAYIKFYFRLFGLRVLAIGVMTLLTAVFGLRAGFRSARMALWIMPLIFVVHVFLWPWLTAPLLVLAAVSSAALVVSKEDRHKSFSQKHVE